MTEPSDEAAVRPFGDFAPSYWNKGLSVIPLEPESKRPARQILGWQGYVNGPPSYPSNRSGCPGTRGAASACFSLPPLRPTTASAPSTSIKTSSSKSWR
jgi:hypothetical protein